jgi:cell division protein FtsQ
MSGSPAPPDRPAARDAVLEVSDTRRQSSNGIASREGPIGARREEPAAGRRGAAAAAGSRGVPVSRVIRFVSVICALCGVAAFAGSSLFDLGTVAVTGNRAIPAPEVLRRAGIAPGDSAFRVNAREIHDRLLLDPRVRDASVDLIFPHRLIISVRERTPVVALEIPSGYLLMGADGIGIAQSSGPGPYLPLIVDSLALPWVQTGTPVPSPDARLGARTADRLPDALKQEVAALRVDNAHEVTLFTRGGILVRIGAAEGIDDRMALVPDVLYAVRARGMLVQSIDLRVPGSAVVLPVGAPDPPAGSGSISSDPSGRGEVHSGR